MANAEINFSGNWRQHPDDKEKHLVKFICLHFLHYGNDPACPGAWHSYHSGIWPGSHCAVTSRNYRFTLFQPKISLSAGSCAVIFYSGDVLLHDPARRIALFRRIASHRFFNPLHVHQPAESANHTDFVYCLYSHINCYRGIRAGIFTNTRAHRRPK